MAVIVLVKLSWFYVSLDVTEVISRQWYTNRNLLSEGLVFVWPVHPPHLLHDDLPSTLCYHTFYLEHSHQKSVWVVLNKASRGQMHKEKLLSWCDLLFFLTCERVKAAAKCATLIWCLIVSTNQNLVGCWLFNTMRCQHHDWKSPLLDENHKKRWLCTNALLNHRVLTKKHDFLCHI